MKNSKKMTEEQITEHRKIIPIAKEEITLFSSFDQILGTKSADYKSEERRERFDFWRELAKKQSPDSYKMWGTDDWAREGCHGCKWYDDNGYWCNNMGLPALYNPVIKGIGMACMGMGRENKQTELEFEA